MLALCPPSLEAFGRDCSLGSACPALPKIDDLVEQDDQGSAAQGSGADKEDHLHSVEYMEGAMPPGLQQYGHDSNPPAGHHQTRRRPLEPGLVWIRAWRIVVLVRQFMSAACFPFLCFYSSFVNNASST
jgi:hypothetical protein